MYWPTPMSGVLLCFTHNITTNFIMSLEWPEVNVVSQSKKDKHKKTQKEKRTKKGSKWKNQTRKGKNYRKMNNFLHHLWWTKIGLRSSLLRLRTGLKLELIKSHLTEERMKKIQHIPWQASFNLRTHNEEVWKRSKYRPEDLSHI